MSKAIKNDRSSIAVACLVLSAMTALSCSPKATSFTRADLLASEQPKGSQQGSGSGVLIPQPPLINAGVIALLKTTLLAVPTDESDFDTDLPKMESDPGLAVHIVLDETQLATFIKSGEASITVPKGTSLSSLVNTVIQGQVFLYVNDRQAVEADMKSRPLSINLKQYESGSNSWEIETSVDRMYLDDLMNGLSQVVITIQKPVSPSPLPSSPSNESYSAIDSLSAPLHDSLPKPSANNLTPTKASLSQSVPSTEI